MRISLGCIFVCLMAVASWHAPVEAAPAFDTCPHVGAFFRVDDSDQYAIVFRDRVPTHFTASTSVLTSTTGYSLELSDIALDEATTSKLAPYRSHVIVFEMPPGKESPSIIVNYGGSCATESRDLYGRFATSVYLRRPSLTFDGYQNGVDREIHATAPRTITPIPGAKLACNVPHRDAIATMAVAPEYPDIARAQGASGVSIVEVDLSDTGEIRDAVIFKSAGNMALDIAALRAAEASTYEPATSACLKTDGSYYFRAEFR